MKIFKERLSRSRGCSAPEKCNMAITSASNMSGHIQKQLTRSLERILEEAHLSGELKLSGRKLKDFPKVGKTSSSKYNLQDTVIAGKTFFLFISGDSRSFIVVLIGSIRVSNFKMISVYYDAIWALEYIILKEIWRLARPSGPMTHQAHYHFDSSYSCHFHFFSLLFFDIVE